MSLNWRVFERNHSWPNRGYYVVICLEKTAESHEKPQSGYPVPRPRFEPNTQLNKSIQSLESKNKPSLDFDSGNYSVRHMKGHDNRIFRQSSAQTLRKEERN
jgi:hypothetical protein